MTAAEASRVDGLYELAFRRHQAGQLREAEELYRGILEIDPRQLDCLHFLGVIALQDGRPEAAVDLIGQAIAGNDRIAAYHAGLAEACGALGQHERAIEHYRKAIEIEPGHWAALHQLGTLLRDQGDANAALEYAKRALTWKDTAQGRALFAASATAATSLPGDPVFRVLLTRAILEAWAPPAELAKPAIAMITSHPAVADGIARAQGAWPQRLAPQDCGPVIAVLAADELLRAVMDATRVSDTGLARLLTSARTILLDAALSAKDDVAPEMIAFAASLARQCFVNGYVFDVSGVEQRGLGVLRNMVATALTGRTPVFGIHVIALAAFAPLHTLDRDYGLKARKWPEPVSALIAEQVKPSRSGTA